MSSATTTSENCSQIWFASETQKSRNGLKGWLTKESSLNLAKLLVKRPLKNQRLILVLSRQSSRLTWRTVCSHTKSSTIICRRRSETCVRRSRVSSMYAWWSLWARTWKQLLDERQWRYNWSNSWSASRRSSTSRLSTFKAAMTLIWRKLLPYPNSYQSASMSLGNGRWIRTSITSMLTHSTIWTTW